MSLRLYLRRREHREIAELQDIIVSTLYSVLKPPPVLHGGTVIWRVYKSPRFSEDIDLYHESVGLYRRSIESELSALKLNLRKFWETPNAFYISISDGREVRVEATKRNVLDASVEAEFELIDGGYIVVRTLPPDLLLKEKIQAYIDRRKARDLYDVFYLLNYVDPETMREDARKLVELLHEPPGDWAELRVLILRGLPPSFETVKQRILGVVR
ncbi:nucleotidyl transferase AbiEii/AbiGii toxin family protein [Infirmifilum lucidum]|uniref:Nucleotidyl transferase AbiEii/AbiGii toxin family protein n=1 Tax=Infirmifilum lucidum TaxID=2776706 RepID=A0A7L9FH87_9CREN|nr:nucleotidyl transferase AbiEii/AbiGii toxin family protein [Infirmifilum lucidum]QOJ78702.1 nucleotidyl transferase AbiEii/AbiGii toxin family protein [Infirmifilum lucidum]